MNKKLIPVAANIINPGERSKHRIIEEKLNSYFESRSHIPLVEQKLMSSLVTIKPGFWKIQITFLAPQVGIDIKQDSTQKNLLEFQKFLQGVLAEFE